MWAWGAPRIHGEQAGNRGFRTYGFPTHAETEHHAVPDVANLPRQSRTRLVSIDFFTVPTARLHVLFVFIVLSHERRRVVHFNITEHPTSAWTAQQIIEVFPEDHAPRYLLRDRDGIYGEYFQSRVHGM